MLQCQVCGYQHETMISPSHLKAHGISGQEYKTRYPGFPLRIQSQASRDKMSNSKKGQPSWNAGIKTGPNEKLSHTKKGVSNLKLRGQRRSAEQRKRISEATKIGMIGKMTNDVKDKLSATLKEGYASGKYTAPMLGKTLSEATRQKIKETLYKTNKVKSDEVLQNFQALAKEENISFISVQDNYWIEMKCATCNSVFTFSRQVFRKSTKGGKSICPICYPRGNGTSELEKELSRFIRSIYQGHIVENDRKYLGGKEIDVLCPELKLGFEFTGLYWHSEKQNQEPKHLLWKTQFAHNEGIRLITIFEDEWKYKQQIVKSRIRGFFGLHSEKINARQCDIVEVTSKLKNEFLETNHIQGKDTSSVALGLFHKDELVSVMTFKKTSIAKGGNGKEWELSRFCSKINTRVNGAASKLLSYFCKTYNLENLPLVSYADRRWSNGDMYKSLGFSFSGTTPPSYWYLKQYEKRIHRSVFMKHRLVKTPEDKLLTEWQLAQNAGLDRIWDCGNTKWMLNMS